MPMRCKELTLIGPGAGGDATASAVVADIADVARGTARPPVRPPGRPASRRPTRAPMQRHEGGYYVRLDGARPPGRRGGRRDPHGAKPTSRSRASCRSARTSAASRDPHGRSGAPVSARAHHLRGDRSRDPRRARRRSPATASSPSRRRSSASSGNDAVGAADRRHQSGSDEHAMSRASPSNRARSSSAS